MDVLIIGTVGYDNVQTPFGKRERALGGSASYASVAASFFAKPSMVAIVGEDFEEKHKQLFLSKQISLHGLKQVPGKTFAWGGKYEFDMNEAKTEFTDLNTLLQFDAHVPEQYRNAKYVFLANTDPVLQLKVIEQLKNPEFIVLDTMNFWIQTKKEDLLKVISKVDVLLLNDGEARMLFNTVNLLQAAQQALKLGPKYVIIKKGEHGALLFSDGKHFSAPGYPLEVIKDPTGCGDCFAGGFIGYLAKHNKVDEPSLRRAIVYGSVIASFNAEDFSLDRMTRLDSSEIEKRFLEMKDIREF
ncbi:sugar kinase [Candidatus Woesearchaeota archaeon]|nr:sugar kinase [Candidatus Woesearchaeota archaeon]